MRGSASEEADARCEYPIQTILVVQVQRLRDGLKDVYIADIMRPRDRRAFEDTVVVQKLHSTQCMKNRKHAQRPLQWSIEHHPRNQCISCKTQRDDHWLEVALNFPQSDMPNIAIIVVLQCAVEIICSPL